MNHDKTDKDFFTLTSKTNTVLGLSQLNYTSSNMGGNFDQSKPSMMRASSLNDNK
jgi:hypothetical protein